MAGKGKTVSIYLSEAEEEILVHRTRDDVQGGRSEAIRRAIRRYAEVCSHDLPELDHKEWSLVADALNGCWLHDAPSNWASAEIEDHVRLNRADEKWHVDWNSMREKMRLLTRGQWIALVDLVERWWAVTGTENEFALPGSPD